MIFSSIFFLYFFLPLTLIGYLLAGPYLRNLLLLTASLFFYAWGEAGYVLLMLFSIFMNWLIGLGINASRNNGSTAKKVLTAGIILNLIPLAFFKYGNFLTDNSNNLFSLLNIPTFTVGAIHLPIGISFFTFQAISYIVDVYRKDAELQRSPINLALYIALFPQLIAGPIVRYHDVAKQIIERKVTVNTFSYGVYRFVFGLGKKILIANNMGRVADHIFSLSPEALPAGMLWLGILAYSLQIYYDFSGYSDMAIGLGRMFGFTFLENFNYPYMSSSIQEFWQRWHISLSSWFKDYLYIPLGGNRKGPARTYFNLFLVFFLCGLWHGAAWTFVAWGIYHGLFLILERSFWGNLLKKLPFIVRYGYTSIAIMIGWIFFRAESIGQAFLYIKSLFIFNKPAYLDAELFIAMNNEFYCALALGLLFAFPVLPALKKYSTEFTDKLGNSWKAIYNCSLWLSFILLSCIIILYSSAHIIGGSHNPFLYFRF